MSLVNYSKEIKIILRDMITINIIIIFKRNQKDKKVLPNKSSKTSTFNNIFFRFLNQIKFKKNLISRITTLFFMELN